MISRFATNLTLLLAAGFVVLATFGFDPATDSWLALGLGCAAVTMSLWGIALRDRGARQRVLDGVAVLAGGWLIVASRAFAPPTARWLAFATAAALTGLAVAGLLLRELELARHLRPRAAAPGPAASPGNGRPTGAPAPARPPAAASIGARDFR